MVEQNCLGKGSYGTVYFLNGVAVKKFACLTHLIQEYTALRYLNDCDHVVHATGVNYEKYELYMQPFDCSLRQFIDKNENSYSSSNALKILKGILIGLAEIHDRGLVHGDLKPGNILLMRKNFHTVIADCGFVSVAHRAKVNRTSPLYKDPTTASDKSHDLFSLGVCMLELLGYHKPKTTDDYIQCQNIVKKVMKKSPYMNIVHALFSKKRQSRPGAREILQEIYGISFQKWKYVPYYSSDMDYTDFSSSRKESRHFMKDMSAIYNIKRARISYGALLTHMYHNDIDSSLIIPYSAVTLLIAGSIFGRSGFKEDKAIDICNGSLSDKKLYKILEKLLDDDLFIKLLFKPSSSS